MTDDEIIAVVTAHKEGKQIQYRDSCRNTVWLDVLPSHIGFDFRNLDYRVKPEPRKPREWVVWVNDLDYLIMGDVRSGEGNWRRITVREVIE